eukprot:TRINITY_DN1378_c0_g1_i4.p1 TRINITY_DN1378_c0_g1~~TRINITY_DN1378_c0_g1_i4.p1  ORF type:complete len:296 (-),score=65.79 TRINITY_DN1378_c0_g1_i4:192-1079(-)
MSLFVVCILVALSQIWAQNPVVLVEFGELFIDPEDFQLFFSDADVYIRCSADGGITFPIRANLDSLDKVGQRKTGPWKFAEWLPAYGSVLYCQAVEEDGGLDSDDPLGESLVVFDFLKGTTIDNPLEVSFFRLNKLQEDGSFELGVKISLSCSDCDGVDYPLSPYWFPKDAPWPASVAEECNVTSGLNAGLNLASGRCCSVVDADKLGDGQCDNTGNYNTQSCGFDFGDCCRAGDTSCQASEQFARIVTITESFIKEAEEFVPDPENITEVLTAIGFEGEQLEVEVEPFATIIEF